jgi:hypothetical protein
MINVNAVLTINGDAIVPVRAIPFVTGGDMGPRCLASILSDPEQNFLAYVLWPNNVVTPMLPKHWRQYKAQLSASSPDAPDLYTQTELAILPASTFVYWEGLWRTHEVNFLPPRELIAGLSDLEQRNYEGLPTQHHHLARSCFCSSVSGKGGVPPLPSSTKLSHGVGLQRGHVSPPVAALGGHGTSPLYPVRGSVGSVSWHGGVPPCPSNTRLSLGGAWQLRFSPTTPTRIAFT